MQKNRKINGDLIIDIIYVGVPNNDITPVINLEESSDIRWFTEEEILKRINNNYEGLTDKTGPWNFLKRYYETF